MHRLLIGTAATLLLLAASAQAAPTACPEGQIETHGGCAPACPTGERFNAPASCECPAGFGKILLGDGGGRCERRACVTGKVVAADSCDCQEGLDRVAAGKGKIQCLAHKAKGTPAAGPAGKNR